MHGGASVLALFNDPAARSERGSESPCPSQLQRVSPREGFGDGRGIKTPGVRIAETKDRTDGMAHAEEEFP